MSLQAAFHKRLRKGLKQNPMGVSGAGGVAKPGWATTKQPIPGGGSKREKAGPGPYTDMPLAPKPPGWKPPRIPRPEKTGDPGGSIWAPPGKTRKVTSRAGKHKNVKAAVMKAVRAAGGK